MTHADDARKSDDSSESKQDQSQDQSQDESFEGQDDPGVISDDQLPEDLQPTDDNPLAKPPSDDDEDQGMSINPNDPT